MYIGVLVCEMVRCVADDFPSRRLIFMFARVLLFFSAHLLCFSLVVVCEDTKEKLGCLTCVCVCVNVVVVCGQCAILLNVLYNIFFD